jgi:hypothetical protein
VTAERKPPNPHYKEVIRRVEKARPGVKSTDPTFVAIIDAILDTDPKPCANLEKQGNVKRPGNDNDEISYSAGNTYFVVRY